MFLEEYFTFTKYEGVYTIKVVNQHIKYIFHPPPISLRSHINFMMVFPQS